MGRVIRLFGENGGKSGGTASAAAQNQFLKSRLLEGEPSKLELEWIRKFENKHAEEIVSGDSRLIRIKEINALGDWGSIAAGNVHSSLTGFLEPETLAEKFGILKGDAKALTRGIGRAPVGRSGKLKEFGIIGPHTGEMLCAVDRLRERVGVGKILPLEWMLFYHKQMLASLFDTTTTRLDYIAREQKLAGFLFETSEQKGRYLSQAAGAPLLVAREKVREVFELHEKSDPAFASIAFNAKFMAHGSFYEGKIARPEASSRELLESWMDGLAGKLSEKGTAESQLSRGSAMARIIAAAEFLVLTFSSLREFEAGKLKGNEHALEQEYGWLGEERYQKIAGAYRSIARNSNQNPFIAEKAHSGKGATDIAGLKESLMKFAEGIEGDPEHIVSKLSQRFGLGGIVLAGEEEMEGRVIMVKGARNTAYIAAEKFKVFEELYARGREAAVAGMSYLLMHERSHVVGGEHLEVSQEDLLNPRSAARMVMDGSANKGAWAMIVEERRGNCTAEMLEEELSSPHKETLEFAAKGYALLTLMNKGVEWAANGGEIDEGMLRNSFAHLEEKVFSELARETKSEMGRIGGEFRRLE